MKSTYPAASGHYDGQPCWSGGIGNEISWLTVGTVQPVMWRQPPGPGAAWLAIVSPLPSSPFPSPTHSDTTLILHRLTWKAPLWGTDRGRTCGCIAFITALLTRCFDFFILHQAKVWCNNIQCFVWPVWVETSGPFGCCYRSHLSHYRRYFNSRVKFQFEFLSTGRLDLLHC